eukprot:938791-Pleurochrysis_carterae.AAC.1
MKPLRRVGEMSAVRMDVSVSTHLGLIGTRQLRARFYAVVEGATVCRIDVSIFNTIAVFIGCLSQSQTLWLSYGYHLSA